MSENMLSTAIRIPFNKAYLTGREMQYVQDAIQSKGWISGVGYYTRKCEALLQEEIGAKRVLLTTSCTHALEMAAMLLNIHDGDEVIVPTFTFVSTVNAFVTRGARPVFCDVRSDTLNMDERKLEALVSPRTRAIVPVHYAGVGCAMGAITGVAERHGVPVIEDNAHGLFGARDGKALGTWGALATLSFHETKNVTCGEGGALVINDVAMVGRAEIIREKGTDRSRFLRGEVDKYTWVDVGSSYVMSDMLAAFLFAQLESRKSIQGRRRELWQRYAEGLSAWAKDRGVRLPVLPPATESSWHMFQLIMPTVTERNRLISSLGSRGIKAVFHYIPLHNAPMGRMFGWKDGDCPVAEDLSQRLVRLPFFSGMTDVEQREVISAVVSL